MPAHELHHVFRRDATQALLRQLSTRALVSGVGAGSHQLLAPAELLGGLRFSRDVEAEADREGLALMTNAQLDARKMVDAFRTLRESEPNLPATLHFLSDHPSIEDRTTS